MNQHSLRTGTIGIDEAGRGPLAGPVVAAAVLWWDDLEMLPGIRDSKQLSEKKRALLFPLICQQAAAYGIGMASAEEIDQLNILRATWLAMERAFQHLMKTADNYTGAHFSTLIDGRDIPRSIPHAQAVIGGDRTQPVIGAASILAKHTRDQWMLDVAPQYPAYDFPKHKGYPTVLHRSLLKKHGPSAIHRKSFRPVEEAWLANAALLTKSPKLTETTC